MASKFAEAVVAIAAQFETKRTSKLAQRIARKTLGDLSDDLHIDACIIDAELQEVRDVIEGLAIRRHIDHVTFCWCEKRWDAMKPHEAKCQRARDLMERMKP